MEETVPPGDAARDQKHHWDEVYNQNEEFFGQGPI
jgi:hypothetical protein